jgi:hypothetical protein
LKVSPTPGQAGRASGRFSIVPSEAFGSRVAPPFVDKQLSQQTPGGVSLLL